MFVSRHHTEENRRRDILYYGTWVRPLAFFLVSVAMFNSMARADTTVGIAVLSAVSVALDNKSPAYMNLMCLLLSIVVVLVWISIHFAYLAE